MANLPEKNVVLVDKITNVPTDSNLFINANGEFKQASVNDVVNSSTVVSTAVETAINTAVQDSIDSNFKQTSGSPILLTDSADGTLIDFKGKGRSTQNGTPTPDNSIAIKSVADSGYFDGELATGYYNNDGTVNGTAQYVSAKNLMPCNVGDVIKFTYAETVTKLVILFFDDTKYLSQVGADNSATVNATAPSGATRFGITIHSLNGITPQTAKPITVTINGKYAFIVKKINVNLFDKDEVATWDTFNTTFKKKTYKLKANTEYVLATNITEYGIIYLNTTTSFIGTARATTDNNGELYIIVKQSEISASEIMLCESTHYNGTHIPHEHDTTYIPLNEPLRGVGNVSDVASLNEVNRRFAKVVFDGSTDEFIDLQSTADGYSVFYFVATGLKVNSEGLCNRLIANKSYEERFAIGDLIYIRILNSRLSSVDVAGLRTWLANNNLEFIYELAEPITETIEPVDIVTYDNVTYLTASDNADMEIEYPTTKVAGIASIGYSKGIKAEYETEQLKKQLLEIQATIVNTL